MKIFRTRQYRGDRLYRERIGTSRRSWGNLRQDMNYYGIDRMTLEVADIPDELWIQEQELEGNPERQ